MVLSRRQSMSAHGYHYGESRHPKLKKFLIGLGVVTVLVGGGTGLVLTKWIRSTPKLSVNKLEAHSENTLNIYSSDNKLLYMSNAIPYRTVSVKDVKKATNLRNALLSTEDRDFYHEGGINVMRTLQSLYADIVHHDSAGGSTITQQLIKLTYFGTSDKYRTLKRKVQEATLAEELTKRYSKDQILAFYMNKVYMGNNLYGMQTASYYYFNKPVTKLDITQAALLAGMVQQPTLYNPYGHYDNATTRRNQVLQNMVDNHKLSSSRFYVLNQRPLSSDVIPANSHRTKYRDYDDRQLPIDSFMTGMWQELKQQKIMKTNGIVRLNVSLNYGLQQQLLSIVNNDHNFPNMSMQCAVTVINNQNGQIVAQAGGRHLNTLGGFNRAFQMKRSSGSSIKPILDYGPAYQLLHWDENTLIPDSPYRYSDGTPVFDWDRRYQGLISTKKALYESRNIPAIEALTQVGLSRVQDFVKNVGIVQTLTQSSAIGINTNTEQMAGLYTALANYGKYSEPTYLVSEKAHNKTQVFEPKQQQLFDPSVAYMLTDALKMTASPLGTAPDAVITGGAYAGKSGTIAFPSSMGMPRDAITDGWYIGYCQGYTVAVWTGYDNPYQRSPYMTNNDGDISQNIYKQVMQATVSMLHANTNDWTAPDQIVKVGDGYQWKTGHINKVGEH